MRLLRFIPIKLTLFLVLGILLGSFHDFSIALSLGIILPSLGFLGFLAFKWKNRVSTLFGFIAFTTTLGLGILTVSLSNPKNLPYHYSNLGFDGKSIWKVKIAEVLKTTPFSERYIARIASLDHHTATGKLLLNLPIDPSGARLEVDDELIVRARATVIRPPMNPHQFDYRKHMARRGIDHQMTLGTQDYLVQADPSKTIYGRAASARNNIIAKLKTKGFGEKQFGIIQALLLGQRNDIPQETYNDYKNAGAVHILAVSGLHIGILLLLLEFLLKPVELLPKGKTLKLVVIVVLLWGFAFLAGLSPSVVRAVTMFTFVAYALHLNRPGNTFNILALSMFFILLAFDPKLLFQVGFQMSYAAVFAIVWIYPILQKFWWPGNKLVRKVWQLLSVSVAAQLGVLPISLFHFHQFPGLFFISNLLVVPFLGLILGLGILVIALASLNLLPHFLVFAYDTLIRWMNTIIGWVAQQESFIFKNISFDGTQLVLVYGIIICSVWVASKATFRRVAALLVTLIGFQLWLFHTSHRTDKKEVLWVAHQSKNSVLLNQKGRNLSIYTDIPLRTAKMAADYQVAQRISTVRYQPIQNSYFWKGKKLLVIDSLGVYPRSGASPDYLLLTQSPKINLDRLIDSLGPKAIIADGSNYRGTVERWQRSCAEKEIPFHHTGEKGAFYFESDGN